MVRCLYFKNFFSIHIRIEWSKSNVYYIIRKLCCIIHSFSLYWYKETKILYDCLKTIIYVNIFLVLSVKNSEKKVKEKPTTKSINVHFGFVILLKRLQYKYKMFLVAFFSSFLLNLRLSVYIRLSPSRQWCISYGLHSIILIRIYGLQICNVKLMLR